MLKVRRVGGKSLKERIAKLAEYFSPKEGGRCMIMFVVGMFAGVFLTLFILAVCAAAGGDDDAK